jgi:hypothetical protein
MEEQCGRTVSDTFGLHRMNEAEVINMPGHVREEIGNPMAGFAVPGKIPGRFHDALETAALAGIGDNAGVVEGEHFAILLREQRFVIKRVDVTWAALHEDENDALRPGAKMRLAGSKGIGEWGGRGGNILGGQPGEGEESKTAGGATQGRAAIQCLVRNPMGHE